MMLCWWCYVDDVMLMMLCWWCYDDDVMMMMLWWQCTSVYPNWLAKLSPARTSWTWKSFHWDIFANRVTIVAWRIIKVNMAGDIRIIVLPSVALSDTWRREQLVQFRLLAELQQHKPGIHHNSSTWVESSPQSPLAVMMMVVTMCCWWFVSKWPSLTLFWIWTET